MLSNIRTPLFPSSITRQEHLFYRTPTSGCFRICLGKDIVNNMLKFCDEELGKEIANNLNFNTTFKHFAVKRLKN